MQEARPGADLLSQGTRDEQRKFIKYNHLIANLLAFHTLVSMTRALQQIQQAGHPIDPAALATFSPYGTEQYNRFGSYALNPNRLPEPLAQYRKGTWAGFGGRGVEQAGSGAVL